MISGKEIFLSAPPHRPETNRRIRVRGLCALRAMTVVTGRTDRRTESIRFLPWTLILFFGFLFSGCTQTYTPKPRGYVRIEPPRAVYVPFDQAKAPCRFNLSRLAVGELLPRGDSAAAINLAYPTLGAKLYGSYFTLPEGRLENALSECRRLVAGEARQASGVTEKAYSNPEAGVYGSLFLLEGDVASPLQFMLTDSLSRLFRGALYYDCRPNADSLGPLTGYLSRDMIELIQSFSWKN